MECQSRLAAAGYMLCLNRVLAEERFLYPCSAMDDPPSASKAIVIPLTPASSRGLRPTLSTDSTATPVT